eukprot:3850371-Pleurochrysis_carterae.AAC.1
MGRRVEGYTGTRARKQRNINMPRRAFWTMNDGRHELGRPRRGRKVGAEMRAGLQDKARK